MAIKYKLVKNSEGRDACINKAEDGVNFNTSIPYDSDNVDYYFNESNKKYIFNHKLCNR